MRGALAFCLAACAACETGRREATGSGRDTAALTAPVGVGASAERRTPAVETLRVNDGTQGMRATVRWVLSPDRRAILVVEDPVSVEAEALPNGFLFANERSGGIVQIDSVWDVAPAPDWSRLAFGRAYILRAGERDTMPAEEWRRLEGMLPEDVASRDAAALRRRLEAHAFPASGMSLMLGLGLTQVIWVDSLDGGRVAVPVGPTHSLDGWRVRWMPSGDTLAIGGAPRMVQDDARPTRWTLVRPRRWADYRQSLGTTTDTSRFARVAWREGPTIELGGQIDLTSRPPIAIDAGTVETRAGSIRLTRRDAAGREESHLVGPGAALAATATGRFILALVPRSSGREHEMRAYPVVYHVTP